jgi:imidazolonepropionase
MAGADYMAIAQAGGGILKSVRQLRAATEADLAASVRQHFDGFLAHGTTTIEAKTGYGLSTGDELKSIAALAAAEAGHPLTVRRTFLGAHEFPPEYRADREAYVRLVIEEMLPKVRGSVTSCDVFAEPKVFDRQQSQRILSAALAHGLRLRVHADEIEPMGGAGLAVELGADSADHLQRISLDDQDRLAASETVAVLLPGTSFLLGKSTHAPARALLDKGCAVALATDFNPGTCYSMSLPAIVTVACVNLKMTPEECVHAITINAAASLQLDSELGTLHAGKWADLVALNVPSYKALGYVFGGNPVVLTIKRGKVAWANTGEKDPSLFEA